MKTNQYLILVLVALATTGCSALENTYSIRDIETAAPTRLLALNPADDAYTAKVDSGNYTQPPETIGCPLAVEAARQRAVRIRWAESTGAGTLLGGGYVLTATHVLPTDGRPVRVSRPGGRSGLAYTVAVHPRLDIALLRLDSPPDGKLPLDGNLPPPEWETNLAATVDTPLVSYSFRQEGWHASTAIRGGGDELYWTLRDTRGDSGSGKFTCAGRLAAVVSLFSAVGTAALARKRPRGSRARFGTGRT